MTSELPLTPEDVNEIAAILDNSPYDRIDISTTRFRLRVARDGDGWSQQWEWHDESRAVSEIADPAALREEEVLPDGIAAIRAQLPGGFYRAPQPGAPPFVKEGDRVGPDTTVAIIETMKLMNPVPAACTGTVEAILVENGVMIERDAPLFYVRLD